MTWRFDLCIDREPQTVDATNIISAALSMNLRPFLFSLGMLAGLGNLSGAQPSGSPVIFDVRQLGAKGDGKSLDTAPIQKALDDCGKLGGGIVTFPSGTYLSKPIFLRSKTTLHLDAGATLLATDDRGDFLRPDKPDATNSSSGFFAFINGKDLTDITIRGKGAIDGSGAKWWVPAGAARRKTPNYTLPRPRMILLDGCKNVRVEGVTLANSPSFHLVPQNCEKVRIDNVTITAPDHSPNTDGIDPSVSRDVVIANCLIDVGDDNIAIKSGRKIAGCEFACEDITITNCVFKHGHGLSIGSETVGGVRNLTVRNCTFEGTENGLRIKSPRGRGGLIENLLYSDITMKGMSPTAITITCYYPRIPETDETEPMTETTPIFRNIRIANVNGTATEAAGVIIGLPESMVTNVVLENVQISAPTGLTIRNAKGIQLKNVKIDVQQGEKVIIKNAEVKE